MRLIKLTLLRSKEPVYINIEMIGHFFEIKEKTEKYTRVGVTTHNNGGFSVVENAKQILKLLEESKGI